MRQLLVTILVSSMLVGCSIPAGRYMPSSENTSLIKHSKLSAVSVDAASMAPDVQKTLPMRGSQLVSPFDNGYAGYLTNALKEEFALAGKLDDSSPYQIGAIVTRNDLDISGFTTGYADIEAKIIVTHNDKTIFEKNISAHHEWPSSFAGPVAMPAAQQNYPLVVQKLVKALLSDPDFVAAFN